MAVAAHKKPKDRLDWLIKRQLIQPEHLELGEHILKLNETRQREPTTHMHFDHGPGGGGGSSMLGRVSARQKWERLFAVVGATGEAIISCIIIDGMSTDEAAEHLNIHQKAMLPMLRFSLDVLARS